MSFRGEDTRKSFFLSGTRKSFTDHLYHALIWSGFIVFFKDDKELKKEVILEELQQAIENYRFEIIVLSKNYAFKLAN